MKIIKINGLAAVLLALLCQACLDNAPDQDVPNNADLIRQQQSTIETFLAENNINATKDSVGYYYHALTEAPGGATPKSGDAVGFYYRFATLEGQLIDEKKQGEDSLAKYTYSDNAVVLPAELDSMLSKMQEGSVYEFFLPFHAAYQSYTKSGVIPANAIVRAQVTLAEVLSPAEEKLTEDRAIKAYMAQQGLTGADSLTSGVYYLQTEAGTGEAVTDGKTVVVRYKGSLLDGTVFDSNIDKDKPAEFKVNGVIEGFETGLKQMRQGGKATVLIPSHAAYGEGIIAIPYSIIGDLLDTQRLNPSYSFARNIPPYAILRFDITLEGIK